MNRTFRVNVYRHGCHVEDWDDPDYYYDCDADVICHIIRMLEIDKEDTIIRLLPVLHNAKMGRLFKTGYKYKNVDFLAEPIYTDPDKYFIEIVP